MSDTKNKNILVVGLGSMGFGIAQSLIRSGYKVYGQDKNLEQQKKLIQEGGFDKDIPFQDLEAVIIVVLNAKQTREIIFGQDGISEKLKKIPLSWYVRLCLQILQKKWLLIARIKDFYI
jgi:3-hydroxyisobutyrate dehydrogenase-like beta-hydroxyacid dehydrogenase